jgi:hypothetical protein
MWHMEQEAIRKNDGAQSVIEEGADSLSSKEGTLYTETLSIPFVATLRNIAAAYTVHD